jgi:hypothetical protein
MILAFRYGMNSINRNFLNEVLRKEGCGEDYVWQLGGGNFRFNIKATSDRFMDSLDRCDAG